MAKMTINKKIDFAHNIKVIIKDENVCKKICQVTAEEIKKSVLDESIILNKIDSDLKKYYSNRFYENSLKEQSGKVWILYLNSVNEKESRVLQVAQALEYEWNKHRGYWDELRSQIYSIVSSDTVIQEKNVYEEYGKNLNAGDSLVFYEIDIEEYLKKYAPIDYERIIYNLAKEYYTEASIAHFTQANWGFYNSGMDKRALFHILEHNKASRIDKQKD